MTKTSSLGNRFQRAWGGEIHVSEPMRITLPSSNPKGCGIKGASVPIADAGADNGRRCGIWSVFCNPDHFSLPYFSRWCRNLHVTADKSDRFCIYTLSGNFRWYHGFISRPVSRTGVFCYTRPVSIIIYMWKERLLWSTLMSRKS